MPKCTLDGKEYEFRPGETVIELADRVGVKIPRFCYHPALTVVAQCRMCAVEIEKMPKLQTACSTPIADGMNIKTASEKAKSMQSSVMEFLLANHPLDCPICDKSGECDLQNYSFDYGAADSRYEEMRRTFMDLDMGPVIKKNMNRCIHCTRCIRFCDEVGGSREMIALKRGNATEITTSDGKPLETEYAGNLADICPTGSLTLKDFRFKKRVWYLKKTPSICEGCSRGCNIELHHEGGAVHRIMPRENQDVNKWWICDEGRFNFHYVNSESRVIEPQVLKEGGLARVDWKRAVARAKEVLVGKVLVLAGSDLTNEELSALTHFADSEVKGAAVFHFGTPDVHSAKDDADADKILKRTSKTSNLHGAEKLGIKAYRGSGSYDAILVVGGGRSQMPAGLKGAVVGFGVFEAADAMGFEVVLPGLSYAEKSGTIVNFQGREQKLMKSIDPRGSSKSVAEVVKLWT